MSNGGRHCGLGLVSVGSVLTRNNSQKKWSPLGAIDVSEVTSERWVRCNDLSDQRCKKRKSWDAIVCVCVGTCFSKINTMLVSWSKIWKFLRQWEAVDDFLFCVSESSDSLGVFVSKSFDVVRCSCGVYPSLDELQTPACYSLASWLAWERWGSSRSCSSHSFEFTYSIKAWGSQSRLLTISTTPSQCTERNCHARG